MAYSLLKKLWFVDDTRGNRLFFLFAALYGILLIMSNILSGAKLVNLYGWVVLSGGTVIFPLSYVINDILSEVYGLKKFKMALSVGIIGLVLASLFTWFVQLLPAAPPWDHQPAYDKILGQLIRINFASLCAILAGSYMNAWIVEKLKWMGNSSAARSFRFISSTAVAEAFDTILFLTIAFAGIMPWEILGLAVIGQWAFKTIWEIVALPVTLPTVRFLTAFEESE